MIRVELPHHLRTLARVTGPVDVELDGDATARAVIDALESRFPALRGTIRDIETKKRRPFVRFFVCERDISHEDPEEPLPAVVARGESPFTILGAMSGG